MGAAICMKLPCLPRMHVCAYMHVHVHVWGGTPQPPSSPKHPPPHPQEPQEAENTKIQ